MSMTKKDYEAIAGIIRVQARVARKLGQEDALGALRVVSVEIAQHCKWVYQARCPLLAFGVSAAFHFRSLASFKVPTSQALPLYMETAPVWKALRPPCMVVSVAGAMANLSLFTRSAHH